MGLVNVKSFVVPLFTQPDQNSTRIDEVLYGMTMQLMQERDGWGYVRTEHGTEGYVLLDNLETNAELAAAWRKYKKMTVLAPYVDVQGRAVTAAPLVATLPRGGILVPLQAPGIGGWQKVGLPGGAVGFTRASYLGDVITDWTKLSEEDMRWNLVETALSYMGAAYRVGGRTPMGIDSMGLVAMAYFLNGVIIAHEPHIKPGMALHSVKVKRMQEGDVLYFGDGAGIYMGNDKFVHATYAEGSEGVVVSSLRPKDNDYRPDLAEHIVAVGSLY